MVAHHKIDTLIWYVVQSTITNSTILSNYRDNEYQVYFKKFVKLDKVYLSNKTTDMTCNEVVQSIKTKRNLETVLENICGKMRTL